MVYYKEFTNEEVRHILHSVYNIEKYNQQQQEETVMKNKAQKKQVVKWLKGLLKDKKNVQVTVTDLDTKRQDTYYFND